VPSGKSLKKEVGSGVGSGSISQSCGSGSAPAPKCHGSPTLLLGLLNTSGAGRPDHDWRQVQVAQPAAQLRPPHLGGLRDDRARHVQSKIWTISKVKEKITGSLQSYKLRIIICSVVWAIFYPICQWSLSWGTSICHEIVFTSLLAQYKYSKLKK
jgi:hypothetical protein